MPFAVGRLVFDRLGAPGHALLGGGAPCGGKCGGVAREGFRKYAIDGVGPAAVMLNDLVGDVGHGKLAWLGAGRADVTGAERSSHSMPKCARDAGILIGAGRPGRTHMCRNIKTLFNFEPPATEDEIHASALQFVRKLSGFNKPSQANAEAFDRAVEV